MRIRLLLTLAYFCFSTPVVGQDICVSTPESMAAARRAIAKINSLTRINTIEPAPSFSILEKEWQNPYTQFPPREVELPWGSPTSRYMYNMPERPEHATGHEVYSGWYNLKSELCCNGNDCESIADVREKTVNGIIYVYVGFGNEKKEWCPVEESRHTIRQPARSPDPNKSHVCVLPPNAYGATVCQRLRCYMGKVQT